MPYLGPPFFLRLLNNLKSFVVVLIVHVSGDIIANGILAFIEMII